MKRCPLCQQMFEDTLKFCRSDGAVLETSDAAPTAILNGRQRTSMESRSAAQTNLLIESVDQAVEISKRVATQAAVGDVLLTNAVMDLVSGSGVAFTNRGTCNLEGVAADCRLFAPV